MKQTTRLNWLGGWWLLAALVLTTIVYWPGLSGSYLFDDYPNIVDNHSVQPHDASLPSLVGAALSSPSSEFKRPLASLSFGERLVLFSIVVAASIVRRCIIGRRQPIGALVGLAGAARADLRLALLQVGAQRLGQPRLASVLFFRSVSHRFPAGEDKADCGRCKAAAPLRKRLHT